jgi:hypothetical protein
LTTCPVLLYYYKAETSSVESEFIYYSKSQGKEMIFFKLVKFKNGKFGVEGTSTTHGKQVGFLSNDPTVHQLALYEDPTLIEQYCQFDTLDFAKQVREDKIKLIADTSVEDYINE